MKCRVWVRAASVVLGLGLLTFATSTARGQQAPPAPLPPNLPDADKQAASATPFQPAIAKAIGLAVTNLTSDKPDVRSAAREWLTKNCDRSKVTPSYASVYCDEFAKAVKPVLDDGKTIWPVRFNVAVVAGTLAETRAPTLIPAVVQLLADKDAAIVYRSMQAAKPLVVGLFTAPPAVPDTTLIPAVVAAVKAQKDVAQKDPAQKDAAGQPTDVSLTGLIVTEAYDALALDKTAYPGLTDPILKPLASPILDVMEFRVGQFATGLPADPGAEQKTFTLLSSLYRNGGMTVAEQHRVVQDLVNYCDAGGRQANLATPAELKALAVSMRNAAQALKVITLGGPGVDGLSGLASTATQKDVTEYAKTVYKTVSQKPDFNYVTQPPARPPRQPRRRRPPRPPAAPTSGPARRRWVSDRRRARVAAGKGSRCSGCC